MLRPDWGASPRTLTERSTPGARTQAAAPKPPRRSHPSATPAWNHGRHPGRPAAERHAHVVYPGGVGCTCAVLETLTTVRTGVGTAATSQRSSVPYVPPGGLPAFCFHRHSACLYDGVGGCSQQSQPIGFQKHGPLCRRRNADESTPSGWPSGCCSPEIRGPQMRSRGRVSWRI